MRREPLFRNRRLRRRRRILHDDEADFTQWLTTMYLLYLINRAVNFEKGMKLLPEIQRRVKSKRQADILTAQA